MSKPEQMTCPFCKDGGKPYFHTGSMGADWDHAVWEFAGCGACGIELKGPSGVMLRWNTRSFAANAKREAAYAGLVRLGVAYAQMAEGVAQTISPRRQRLLKDAVISAAGEVLMLHAGTIRSALNDFEKGE